LPKGVYYKPEMSAKEFFEYQVDASNAFEEDFKIVIPTNVE